VVITESPEGTIMARKGKAQEPHFKIRLNVMFDEEPDTPGG